MNDRIAAIAEEEIERTAQEAVKAALIEIGSELAAEKRKRKLYEQYALDLEYENRKLAEENRMLARKSRFWKAAGMIAALSSVSAGIAFGIKGVNIH